ncbi:uncharacterized protein [Rutidosis leptorrhynchoides]|uniref:uncharacterized protein n=1 Tax=Rutidosis leptorrhynchoides TaxID=125765 RepID=UPI003A98E3B4
MVKRVTQPTLNEIWKHFAFDSIQKEASGRSGGLLSIWRLDFFSLIHSWSCKHWIATILRYLPNNQIVFIVNIYAPHLEHKKHFVWSQLTIMANQWPGPLCFLGYFNSVRSPEERLREVIDQNSIDSFNDFILQANLIDQVLSNDEFTWEGPLGKFSRIDRVLINDKWALLWPEAILQTDPQERSDHKPLIWAKVLANWGPKPFRFNNTWISKPGFLRFCDNLLNEYNVEGWEAFKVAKKLRVLKADLKI